MSSTPSAIGNLSGLFDTTSAPGTGGMAQMPSNTLMGGNQYMSYPAASGQGAPGTVPTQPALPGASSPYSTNTGSYYATGGDVPGTNSIHIDPTMDPTLTQQYYNMLSQQVGQGLPGFDLSTLLPSSGTATTPGALNAPLNNVYQQLQSLLTGGPSTIPGSAQATQMAQTGNPINQTPAWQAMIASQQQNTAQNANQLREQFAGTGSLSSSPFATAMQQFYNQNTENQNAQLTQATATAQENAMNRELNAQQGLEGLASTTGSNLQTIDQNAIDQMLKEFYVSLPQDNPLLSNVAQGANMQPSVAGQTPTTTQNISSLISSLGTLF